MAHFVTGPDGKVHRFEDSDSDDFVNAEMTKRYNAPAPGRLLAAPGLQQSGEGTVATGQVMPNLQKVPERIGGDDWETLAMSMMFPKAAEVLSKTPGKVYQTEMAKKSAETLSTVEAQQRGGSQILASYANLKRVFDQMPDDVLHSAIGPRNMAELQETSPTFVPFTNLPIPGLSGPTTVDPKTKMAVAGVKTPVERAAILNPNDKAAQDAWKAQKELTHLTESINATMMMLAGKGLNPSDSRQKLLGSLMNDFLHAPDRKGAAQILDHAKTVIANDYNLPADVADKVVNAHLTQIARKEQEHNLLEAAAKVPPDAYKQLLDHAAANNGVPDPVYVQSFNKHFNGNKPGLAERLTQNRRP